MELNSDVYSILCIILSFCGSGFFFQEKKLFKSFDFTLRCRYDVLSLNNSLFKSIFNNFYTYHLSQSIWDKEYYRHQNSTPYFGIQIIPQAKLFKVSQFECPYCMLPKGKIDLKRELFNERTSYLQRRVKSKDLNSFFSWKKKPLPQKERIMQYRGYDEF
jgi:hypothetical protein